MIKNKGLDIKIIFETYLKILKILKIGLKLFKFAHKFLFYKISNNSFQKLF